MAFIAAASVSLVATTALPTVNYEWLGTGEPVQKWHRDFAPIVVAILPHSRLPSQYPDLRLIFSGTRPDRVDWNVEDTSRVSLSNEVPGTLPTATPGVADEKYVVPGEVRGRSSITVTIGPPYDRRIRIPTYTYASVYVGCAVGAQPGVRFDEQGFAHAADVSDSDLYETGPPLSPQGAVFWGCPNGFATKDTQPVLHVPGGGRIIPLDASKFGTTRVSDWRADTNQVLVGNPSMLIFRLRDGRTGKVLWAKNDGAAGAYCIASAGKDFPDVIPRRARK